MKKTNFRTRFDEQLLVCTEPGSGIKEEFQLRITDDGEDLVKIGESSLYDYIQSHADSVDIHKILERCAMMDDYSMLNRLPAQFMDVTEMPKNLAEAHAAVQDARNYFNALPLEIRQEYENNFTMFLQDLGSDHFIKLCEDVINNRTPELKPDMAPDPDEVTT